MDSFANASGVLDYPNMLRIDPGHLSVRFYPHYAIIKTGLFSRFVFHCVLYHFFDGESYAALHFQPNYHVGWKPQVNSLTPVIW
jgi:hypothetical protein